MERFKAGRKKVAIVVIIYSILMAVSSLLAFGILSRISFDGLSIPDIFDFAANSVIVPVVAFLTCIFVGFIIKPKTIIDEILSFSEKFKSEKLYVILIKYVSPTLIVLILISSISEYAGNQ